MKYTNVHQGTKRTRDTHRRLCNEKKARAHTLATIQPVRGSRPGKRHINTHAHKKLKKKSSKGKSRRHTGVHPAVLESIQKEVKQKQKRASTKYEIAATQLEDAARGKGRAIYTHICAQPASQRKQPKGGKT